MSEARRFSHFINSATRQHTKAALTSVPQREMFSSIVWPHEITEISGLSVAALENSLPSWVNLSGVISVTQGLARPELFRSLMVQQCTGLEDTISRDRTTGVEMETPDFIHKAGTTTYSRALSVSLLAAAAGQALCLYWMALGPKDLRDIKPQKILLNVSTSQQLIA